MKAPSMGLFVKNVVAFIFAAKVASISSSRSPTSMGTSATTISKPRQHGRKSGKEHNYLLYLPTATNPSLPRLRPLPMIYMSLTKDTIDMNRVAIDPTPPLLWLANPPLICS
jgi:hypothetical protein